MSFKYSPLVITAGILIDTSHLPLSNRSGRAPASPQATRPAATIKGKNSQRPEKLSVNSYFGSLRTAFNSSLPTAKCLPYRHFKADRIDFIDSIYIIERKISF